MPPMKCTLLLPMMFSLSCTPLTEAQKEERAYNYQITYEQYLRNEEACTDVWVTGSQAIATRIKRRPTLAEMRFAGCMDYDTFARELAYQMAMP